MLIQSSHNHLDRGLDQYFTPPEATISLLAIEREIPDPIWEPACGNGAISKVLLNAGFTVYSTDIQYYGYGTAKVNYLDARFTFGVHSIITNPPFKLAAQFVQKAITEVPYVALLLRTNFLESTSRLPLFRSSPPSRVWISSRRLPMMHRLGWTGPEAPSNICFAWFIWDQRSKTGTTLNWFDWEEHQPTQSVDVDPVELGL